MKPQYRIWDTSYADESYAGEMIYLNQHTILYNCERGATVVFADSGDGSEIYCEIKNDWPSFDEKKLIPMMGSGKLDKNSKQIFVNDLVKICRHDQTHIGKIEYDENYAAFIVTGGDEIGIQGNLLGQFKSSIIEVIGNIYENPEIEFYQ